jgi:hypothetical protein
MFVVYDPQGGTAVNIAHATSRKDFSVYCDTDGYYRMWFKNDSFIESKTVWCAMG